MRQRLNWLFVLFTVVTATAITSALIASGSDSGTTGSDQPPHHHVRTSAAAANSAVEANEKSSSSQNRSVLEDLLARKVVDGPAALNQSKTTSTGYYDERGLYLSGPPVSETHNTVLTVGYLTAIKGSMKEKQGLAISGAITIAIDEVS